MSNMEGTALRNEQSTARPVGLSDDWILADTQAFSPLTARERTVCLGILTGYTSEAIALNLGISINSVLTYRKRIYEKLRITSQNELFMLTFRHLITRRSVEVPSGSA
ncbi:helix-turn-helix transcriptional regulator [Paraburkholderia strydomiana]|jgi:DNA-binding CsgD family transcriptional regulator|uniref:helix-turn-helix transcriptional regulator n=1 Tax=Paraburkholderia TaxID=1822464 RepID=UPI0038B9FA9B